MSADFAYVIFLTCIFYVHIFALAALIAHICVRTAMSLSRARARACLCLCVQERLIHTHPHTHTHTHTHTVPRHQHQVPMGRGKWVLRMRRNSLRQNSEFSIQGAPVFLCPHPNIRTLLRKVVMEAPACSCQLACLVFLPPCDGNVVPRIDMG